MYAGKVALIIEDDDDSRALLQELLLTRDFTVLESPDFATAESLLNGALKIDLVFSDLTLPDVSRNGEIVERIRSTALGKNIPIFLVSGHADLFSIAAEKKVEAIHKPFDIKNFFAKISALLAAPARGDA